MFTRREYKQVAQKPEKLEFLIGEKEIRQWLKQLPYYGTGRRKIFCCQSFHDPRQEKHHGQWQVSRRVFPAGLETLKRIVLQPLAATGTADQFDVKVTVRAARKAGQAGAVRHGIARALNGLTEKAYRPILKKRIPHQRFPMKERKYGRKAARRAPQFSKR